MAGIRTRILVMADFRPSVRDALVEFGLTPVICNLADVREWSRMSERSGALLRYHLEVDSSMVRRGTRAGATEIAKAVLENRGAALEGLMTQFASAVDCSSAQPCEQIVMLERLRSDLAAASVRPPYVHLATRTPVACALREACGNMVRTGHAIYGYRSAARGEAQASELRVEPALSWKARVLAVKELQMGALVGYGGTYPAERPTRIAVLAAGYADGVPHRMSNRGKVIADGRLVPVIGAVSMQLTTIDITNAPGLRPGDAVTLLGREGDVRLNAQQIARWAGTISDAVLCGISPRLPRVYL